MAGKVALSSLPDENKHLRCFVQYGREHSTVELTVLQHTAFGFGKNHAKHQSVNNQKMKNEGNVMEFVHQKHNRYYSMLSHT